MVKCCCGSGTQIEPADADVEQSRFTPASERRCRDLVVLILFGAFWIGMILIAIVGIDKGDPYRLVYATDYNGNTCGKDGFSKKDIVYYPRMNKDLVEQSGKSPMDMSFYGICVSECPATGTYVCDYDTQAKIDSGATSKTQKDFFDGSYLSGYTAGPCWYVPMETENIFFRCLPKEQPQGNVTERCKNPNGGYYGSINSEGKVVNTTRLSGGKYEDDSQYYYFDKKTGYYTPSAKCDAKEVERTSLTIEQGQDNPLMDQMASTVATIARWGGDISTVKMELAICSLIVCMVLCFAYLLLLKKFGACIIWSTIYTVIVACILLSLLLSVKAGMIGLDDYANLSDQVAQAQMVGTGQVDASLQKAEKNQEMYQVFAWISIVVTLIIFVVILFMRKNVKVAIAIMQEASEVVGKIPVLIAWPLVPYAMLVCLLAYWVSIGAFIYTVADVTLEDFKDASGTTANTTSIQSVSSSNIVNMMSFYHLFGLLWTNNLIQAISMCTIAGVTCEYYWTKDKTELKRRPVWRSFYRCLRYHMGSLAFGALIIAIVQMVRICLEYLDQKTKNLQQSNIAIKLFMKVVKCCLCILEKVIKYISKNAYIVVAMKGKSFCSATMNAFKLLFANIKQIAITAAISTFMLLLGKVAITVACTVLLYILIETNDSYAAGGLEELSSPMMPLLICAMVGWFISTSFMNVYGMCVDSLLLCYCEDKAVNKEGTYFMSERLLKAINAKKPAAKDNSSSSDDDDGDDGAVVEKEKKKTAPKQKKSKPAPKPKQTKIESFSAADVF